MKWALVAVAAALTGCSYAVKTPDAPLELPAVSAPGIGVSRANIDVSQTENTRRYSDFQSDFFATLTSTSESSGLVVASGEPPLRLFAALKFAALNSEPNIVIGVASMFLPPLAFVPEERAESYSVKFVVRDRNDAVVYRNAFEDSVGGEIKGWYIARINAWHDLKDLLAAAAARSAARRVLQDLQAHADKLAARMSGGAAPPRPETAPEKGGAAPAVPAADEWWRKTP